MVIVQNKLVSDDLLSEHFICNLKSCKGACCVEGDMGAPLEQEETIILEQLYPLYKKFLTAEGISAIESNGFYVKDDENYLSTPLIDNKACVYIQYDSLGVAKCGIEIAYYEGLIDFKKPISCHLYPIRVTKMPEDSFDALNYDQWDICKAACELGKKEKVPVFKFLKEPIIRKYGSEFYDELEHAFNHIYKDSL